ncbi:MAG TPA: hypothetical protein PLW86_03160, partial [Rhodocyclaceae bacterium]|nr:hypothetical protein [Rhodocyclaceae bacterium]
MIVRIGFLVFSGYNERAVIAFLRVLKRYDIDVFIVANGPNDRILRTAYASDVCFVRPQGALDVANMSQALDAALVSAAGHRLLLAPSTEGLNRFFLANPELLANRGIMLPLVDQALYQQISDKFSFGELCRSAGIGVPENIADPARCALPFVAKPLVYELASPLAPRLILTESDRLALLSSPELPKYYFQQFVEGRSIYLLLHFSGRGEVCAF